VLDPPVRNISGIPIPCDKFIATVLGNITFKGAPMLSYGLLKNHAGILLVGDYTSLRWLRDVVHHVNDRSPLVKDPEGPFIGLAYDCRKAYEQQREVIEPPKGFEEIGVRFGVKILWPVLLLQQRILRLSLSFIDNSAKMQSITYALEAIIEEALREDFGLQAQKLIDLWKRLDPAQPAVVDLLHSRGAVFCSWSKAHRKLLMAELLTSFDPLYSSYFVLRLERGEKNLISPGELALWENAEWPDPKW
jgi:hypothetical protein